MRNQIAKKSLALFLTALMLLSSVSLLAGAASGFAANGDFYQISDTEYKIAPGIKENRVVVNHKKTGTQQEVVYAVSVDMSAGATTGVMAGYADYNGSTWKMQTVRDQAVAAKDKTGANIVAAFNADIFNMSTGEPTGCLVMGGKVYKAGLGRPYFGITKDGQVVIGNSLKQGVLDTLQEAISGFYMIVQDGNRVGPATDHGSNIAPKTAVGIKEDGSLVVVAIDGRNYPVSNSLDDYDLATIMMDLGCKDVLNLDGGGSSTYLAKYEGQQYLALANNPSDAIERKVASSLFITSTATPSGVFDHASLTPNNVVYTPGSEVQFSAVGVDSAGEAAPLPEDGTFALADDSFGTMTPDGKFTANEKTGTVTVNYMTNGAVKGTTTIEIAHPDYIGFANEELSLGFEKESTLGLTVKYQDRDIVYTAKDIAFTLSDEKLGTFNGLTFISSPSETINGTITASYVNNPAVSGSINMIIGRLPTVVYDFEDVGKTDALGNPVFDENGQQEMIPAEEYYSFSDVFYKADGGFYSKENPHAKMAVGTYVDNDGSPRGGQGSVDIVDISSGEPVRFGNKSLKVNYDFSQCGKVTEGVGLGPMENTSLIDGIPTGIGMWLYAPEGTPNLWVRVRVKDGSGTTANLDFVPQTKNSVNGGIDWQGWKYVEASLENWTGPFSLMGGEVIRLMYVAGLTMGFYTKNEAGEWITVPQANRKGSLYIDNVQFVYGANVDDIDNPYINSIEANLNEITNNMEIDSNKVSFRATYGDVQNKYTTGVDPSTVAIFIDGMEMTHKDNCFILDGDETIRLEDVELANGSHTVKVRVRDGFGNETVESRSFVVNGDKTYPSVTLEPIDEKPILGETFSLALKTEDAAAVESLRTEIRIDADFPDYTVTFADGFTGTHSYDAKSKSILLTAEKAGDVSGDTIATLTFDVPDNLDEGKTFTYAVPSGSAVFAGSFGDNFVGGFSANQKAVPVAAQYVISYEPMVVGFDGVIYVKDTDGNAVEGATVNSLTAKSSGGFDSEVLGTTDANGKLVTKKFTEAPCSFILQANVGSALTFKVSGKSTATALNTNGKPQYIMTNAVQDSTSEENISWLSNPAATDAVAEIMYAEKSAYDTKGNKAFTIDEGKSTLHQFLGSSNVDNNYAVRVNSVTLTGLKPDTEYVYRVGDGNAFSPINTFKTTRKGAPTSFFVIGDAQAVEKANFDTILGNLKADENDYSFGIQTGDAIEVANVYGDWVDLLDMFSNDYLKSVDILHVFGNHEYMSDPEGTSAKLIYNVEDESHYSVEYGNVYVATIAYTTDMAKLEAALEWLKEDAAKSTCQWKVLTIHQPPYYTHTAGGNEPINERVPAAAEAAGIDFVFSGHDHSYARTKPLLNGAVDEENGITYYICGSTGAKSYPVQDTGFDFEIATQNFDGIYLTCQADDKKFTVLTHELNGEVIDSYTKEATTPCVTDGHTYAYSEEGYLTCSVCGHTEPLGNYTGFAADEATGKNRYFINGTSQVGWLNYESDVYYFDENGLTVPAGKQEINGIPYTFDESGKQVGGAFVQTPEGYTRCYRGADYLVGWNEIDGDTYFFTSNSETPGKMYTGKATILIYTGQEVTYEFAKDGRLLKGAFVEEDGNTKYYWGQDPQLGWQEIDGATYYFNPETGYMVTNNAEIDGKMYAFTQDGKFVHDGAHDYGEPVHQKGTCTEDEADIYTCSICGTKKTDVIKAAIGHVDEDNDKLCDNCGRYMRKVPSFLEPIFRFLRKIINWFLRLVRRLLHIG